MVKVVNKRECVCELAHKQFYIQTNAITMNPNPILVIILP